MRVPRIARLSKVSYEHGKDELEGQLDVVEYSRIIVPESVQMGYPAGGTMEIVNARKSARAHLMAWQDTQAMHEFVKVLMTFRFNPKEEKLCHRDVIVIE